MKCFHLASQQLQCVVVVVHGLVPSDCVGTKTRHGQYLHQFVCPESRHVLNKQKNYIHILHSSCAKSDLQLCLQSSSSVIYRRACLLPSQELMLINYLRFRLCPWLTSHLPHLSSSSGISLPPSRTVLKQASSQAFQYEVSLHHATRPGMLSKVS